MAKRRQDSGQDSWGTLGEGPEDRSARGRIENPFEEPDSAHLHELVRRLIQATDPDDPRRRYLLQLRRELLENERTLEELKQKNQELEEIVEKLTAPANRIGIFLDSPREGIAHILVGGSEYFAAIDPRLDTTELETGTRVLLNEAYAVIGVLGYPETGALVKVTEAMEDGRLRIGQEPGGNASLLVRAAAIRDVPISAGDEVRVDSSSRIALEVFPKQEARDYFLDEVPELPWSKVGGQAAAIKAIRDAVEMPILHPELFQRFQFQTPKGFLLYGPPGCGKTLIGKATAYNLVKRLREETGKDVEGQFLHIKGPEILNMWLGESERRVREIFNIARQKRKEGILPFVFIDEAEAILGTRRAFRAHNISNTIVPMFCAEMDGIESLQEVVLILATNRPDLIDPAILRPGRIDRKIKVKRPDRDGCREIFAIYLTPDLPIDRELVAQHDGSAQGAVEFLIDQAMEELFARRDDTRFLEVHLASGAVEVLYRSDLVSGAIIASIVQRAKEFAFHRSVEQGQESGITANDLIRAIDQEYRENDIFPPSDNTEDWLKLIDYDPEHVVRVLPIRPDRMERRHRSLGGIV
ncbi:MAG: proteasome-associated ATPase [Candidatus Poribacteria bacterium]|nr:MAG: proteasome-associated ATPase [Candidatus Poribacteria bacterium]